MDEDTANNLWNVVLLILLTCICPILLNLWYSGWSKNGRVGFFRFLITDPHLEETKKKTSVGTKALPTRLEIPYNANQSMIPALLVANAERAGLHVHDVHRDGNCLFAAIADQLQIRNPDSSGIHTASVLRENAIEHLRRHSSNDGSSEPYSAFVSDESWESYLNRMSRNHEWGDNLMLQALADRYRRRIVVLRDDTTARTVLEPNPSFPLESFGELYVGYIGSNHYVSLRPNHVRHAESQSPSSTGDDNDPNETDNSSVESPFDTDEANDYGVIPRPMFNMQVGDNNAQTVHVPQDYRTVVNITIGNNSSQTIVLPTTFHLQQDVIDYIQRCVQDRLNVNGTRLVVKLKPADGETQFSEQFDPILIDSINNDGRDELDRALSQFNLQIYHATNGCVELTLIPKSWRAMAKFVKRYYEGGFATFIKHLYSLAKPWKRVSGELPSELSLDVSLRLVRTRTYDEVQNPIQLGCAKSAADTSPKEFPTTVPKVRSQRKHKSERTKKRKTPTPNAESDRYELIYSRDEHVDWKPTEDIDIREKTDVNSEQTTSSVRSDGEAEAASKSSSKQALTNGDLTATASETNQNQTHGHARAKRETDDATTASDDSDESHGLRVVLKPASHATAGNTSSVDIEHVLGTITKAIFEQLKRKQNVKVSEITAEVTTEKKEPEGKAENCDDIEIKRCTIEPDIYKKRMLQRPRTFGLSTQRRLDKKPIIDRTLWEKISSSVIRLLTRDNIPVGTGFLIGERYVLTCHHVIMNVLAQTHTLRDTLVVIQTVLHGGYNPMIVRLVYQCESLDVAILQIQVSARPLEIPAIDIVDVQPGDTFCLVGSRREGASLTSEEIVFLNCSSIGFREFDSTRNIPFSSRKFFQGTSGSPCLIQRGGNVYIGAILVGMVQKGGPRSPAQIHFGLKMTALYDALRDRQPKLCERIFGKFEP